MAIRPVEPQAVDLVDGYPRLEDLGLIGDGATAALVSRDGAIVWLCVPRFDSDPLFCSLLDAEHGGRFTVRPEGLQASSIRYEDSGAVLVTDMRTRDGTLELIDCMTLRRGADLTEDAGAERSELLRVVEVTSGTVRLEVDIEPRRGAEMFRRGGNLCLIPRGHSGSPLRLFSTARLDGPRTVLDLEQGQRVHFVLRWSEGSSDRMRAHPDRLLDETRAGWRRWIRSLDYDGPQRDLVTRSAITLKMLDHVVNGAIVAAPTSSLPEEIGGERNWDYRYAWVRDAAFSVYALHRIGLSTEARAFLAWVLDVAEKGERPRVLYDLDGGSPLAERIDAELEGYRGSQPVRWGNAAADQVQHDVFGEIIDCAYQWSAGGGHIDEPLWGELAAMADMACEEWNQPDQGIWEVRTDGRPFTYSAALCHVAVDRAVRLSERHGLPGNTDRWAKTATEIRRAIVEDAWDADAGAIAEHLGGGGLDAGLLALPLRRVVPADHPRMIATAEAISERLGAGDGLLYRYLVDESPDGLRGHEGAFLLCSFWLVDNLAGQGRLDEAHELFESLCARTNALGLLPEQIDPSDGSFLGNFPQAFSHVGLISSGVNLARRSATMPR